MRYIIISAIQIFLMFVAFRFPHQISLKGQVQDMSGTPLKNVMVSEEGTSNFTLTDADGAFVLGVGDKNSQLKFSVKGYALVSRRNGSGKLTIVMRNSSYVDDSISSAKNLLLVNHPPFVQKSGVTPSSIVVRGWIRDPYSNPLPGIIVSEKGASNSTISDAKGFFSIAVKNEQAQLVYTSKDYLFTGKSIVDGKLAIVMKATKPLADSYALAEIKSKRASEAVASHQFAAPLILMAPSMKGVTDNGVMRKPGRPSYGVAKTPASHDKIKSEDEGDGNFNTEDYDAIVENEFLAVNGNPLSTFSIDVDAASYSNIRRYLQSGQLPPAGSVRIEEMINYFNYEYPKPLAEQPFSINTEMSVCPWNPRHNLVLVGLQGKKIPTTQLPASNLVFLIDVSGSMSDENKLPLVKASMKLLVDQLREQDKVSIVVYAGNAGLALSPTSGSNKTKIKDAIDRLEAGGSTAGGQGIKLAYKTAVDNFVRGGNNRVILCTDGDFNVGVSSDAELEGIIETERKTGVFLTVLGYGMGNYKDNKMQKLADKGNGNHAYIDGMSEARKVLVNEFGGTLFTIAKDVKLQVEFNPAKVQAYRLIGYENRMLQKEDFNNDAKDAGELGSGHTVTALYELIPTGVNNEFAGSVDPLKYQQNPESKVYVPTAITEVMTIKLRYKKSDGDVSKMITHPVPESRAAVATTSSNYRFAASVAEFGMLLRNSKYKQSSSFEQALQLATSALANDAEGYKSEFLSLVKSAQMLARGKVLKTEVIPVKY